MYRTVTQVHSVSTGGLQKLVNASVARENEDSSFDKNYIQFRQELNSDYTRLRDNRCMKNIRHYLTHSDKRLRRSSGYHAGLWFAGSNSAEAVGFFGCPNNPKHAFLRRGSERICPMSQ